MTANASPSATDAMPHQFVGSGRFRRVGRIGFPVFELTQDREVLARLGRTGWFKIYFWSGQRIELSDGEQWRLRSVGARGSISPLIVNAEGRIVAMAGLRDGSYGISGRDFACALYPAHKPRIGRANRWILRHFEQELALITRHPLSVEAAAPVHLGAVLLSFALVRFGLPDEATPGIPEFRWGRA
jgi:hypothetical protein